MPAYNAARHIASVIDRMPESVWPNVNNFWIINDGSTDETGNVIDELSHANAAIKPQHFDRNKGYGEAVRQGLELCKVDRCDAALCLHADGQYPPESLPQLAAKVFNDGYDIVQGSRIASKTALSGGMPLYKFVANRSLTFFENIVFGLKMTDYHSGYLIYSRKALESIPFDTLSAGFDFDLEVIACARARSLKIGEVPIQTRYADEISHLNPIRYGLRVVGVMINYFLGRYK
ncbi:MAG: glycosyltransferase [Chitinivibrionales bacterium]|nr:glycosyltransferase [Chitinivibrionales bacterium]